MKDQYNIKGVDSSIGFTAEYNKPATEDCEIVKILKAEGAIPFCKTNVPQTMLSFECSNPLNGTTTNPYDKERTCGGSSGGEGCMLGSDASPFGFGSDVSLSFSRSVTPFVRYFNISISHISLCFLDWRIIKDTRSLHRSLRVEAMPW